jgi:cell division septum initiation protein DivIVA
METFSYVKRGYNPEEVDAYISTLEQVIKSYKDKDNAIKNAIISAQVAADNILKNAHLQADEYKSKIRAQLKALTDSIGVQRMRVKTFQDLYSNMLHKYLHDFEEKDTNTLYERLSELEKTVNDLNEMDALDAMAEKPPETAPVSDKKA